MISVCFCVIVRTFSRFCYDTVDISGIYFSSLLFHCISYEMRNLYKVTVVMGLLTADILILYYDLRALFSP